MTYFYVILAALAPVLALLWYIYKKDQAQPEPISWLLYAVLLGVLSPFVSLTLTGFLKLQGFEALDLEHIYSVSEGFKKAFIWAAIPEETSKLLMLWILVRNNPFFDEHMDGIVYAACVGLGFAGLENILYLANGISDGSWIAIGISRSITAVPGHFMFAVAMGYFYSLYHFGIRRNALTKLCIWLVPVLMHGIYDGILFSTKVSPEAALFFLLIFLIFFRFIIRFTNRMIERLRTKATLHTDEMGNTYLLPEEQDEPRRKIRVIRRKRDSLMIVLAFSLFASAQSASAAGQWGEAIDARHDSILALITGADNRGQAVVNIRQLGARPVTPTSCPDCLPAFRKAMQRAARSQTGLHIVVPAGDWFVKGPIHLVSHVTLELEEGAHLLFSDRPEDYLPAVQTSWEGNFCTNYSPFIYGKDLTDVTITGRGTIDGNCAQTFPTWRSNQKADQMLLRHQCHTDVPYSERLFGEGHLLRPHLIQLYNCRNITLEGVLITNSPFWCIHLLGCENIICRALRYDAKLINNDGIDPEMSRNILIEDVEFNNGDDNVAIKAGRDNDGWKEARPSENIIIRRCRFKGLHGVVIGSEMSAGVRNVFVEDCSYGGYNKRALYVKTNPNRGGFVHDIYFRNCEFGEMEDLFYITSMYAGEGADDHHFTDIHDIHARDIHARRVNNAAIVLQGTVAFPLRDISFERVVVDSCRVGFSATYAPDVRLSDCHLGGCLQSAPSQISHSDHIFER